MFTSDRSGPTFGDGTPKADPLPGQACGQPNGNAEDPFNLQRLQKAFGFTPAEARVAAALATGESVAGMSKRLGVQVNTARAHIKQVLGKTGTMGQAQAVAAMWRWVWEHRRTG